MPTCRGPVTRSGFSVDVGGAENDVADQAKAAVRFLQHYASEILRARSFPGIQDLTLDFSTSFRQVVVQSEFFPADLVSEAGALGVSLELSLYPPSKE